MDWQTLTHYSGAVLITAFLLDLAIGDPRWLPHPVVLMGRLIGWGERLLWIGKPGWDFLSGMILSLMVVALSAGVAWALVFLFTFLPPLLAFIATALLASMTLATRGLLQAISRIEETLRKAALVEARRELSQIVGRETEALSEDKVVRASLESLAENTSDGIVAPLFYLALGGVPLAMAYKAVNTLDSMIGYRTERYFYFGKFAARLDDLFNFLPARLSALFLVLAAYLRGLDGSGALKTLWRDRRKHISPNAGYPEAALAGAFGIRLGGPSVYLGREVWKPYIGQETVPLQIGMLREARKLCLITALLSLVTVLVLLQVTSARF